MVEERPEAQFAIGEVVHHLLFDYRGVIVDIDPEYGGTEEWYRKTAKSRPPRDRPWYHVLVDGTMSRTYVAERNLEKDTSNRPISHPGVDKVFDRFDNGYYIARKPVH